MVAKLNRDMSKKNKNKKHKPQIIEKSNNNLIYGIIILLTFILYGNTIPNDYALDDIYSVTGNQYTKSGFQGIGNILSKNYFAGFYGDMDISLSGGRYRPLSLITFACEYEFFGENPHISHFINVLLFAFTGILIFVLLSKILINFKSKKWYFSIAFLTSLLFILHPIHTEVVANIKGRDEILSMLGSLLTLWFLLKYVDNKKTKYLIWSFICFFLALLSKENAITFIVIIPLTIYFFRKKSLKNNLAIFIPIALATILFIIIRQLVVGGISPESPSELMDNPFLEASFFEKYATIFYTLGLYLKLLFFPNPLTWDYYPYHIPLINPTDLRAIIPLIIYLSIGIYAILTFKKKNIISYGILFFLISLSIVSNLVISIGAFMAERFVYVASLGFCFIIAYLLSEKLPKIFKNSKTYKTVLISFMAIVIILFSYKTISRNKVWKDDFTLYTTDVKTSKNSAKSNNIAGQHFAYKANKTMNQADKKLYFNKSIKHLRKAIEIHPKYMDALFYLGNVYYDYNKNLDSTFYYYLRILEISPKEEQVFTNANRILNSVEDIDYRINIYQKLYSINPKRYDINYSLGQIFGEKKNDLDSAIFFMKNAVEINPQEAAPYKFLGTAYYLKNDFKKAETYFIRAIELSPDDERIKNYLAYAYQQLGKMEKAKEILKTKQD